MNSVAAKTFASVTEETILTEFLIVANSHSEKKHFINLKTGTPFLSQILA